MMILTWLLTFILVVDCLVLALLVLIQLPKKEAGMGQAFGGGATDALFGAGSGTALTKMTKYTAGIFFLLTMLLAVLHGRSAHSTRGDMRNLLPPQEKVSPVIPTNRVVTQPAISNLNLTSLTNPAATNPAPTNPAPAAAQPSTATPVEKK